MEEMSFGENQSYFLFGFLPTFRKRSGKTTQPLYQNGSATTCSSTTHFHKTKMVSFSSSSSFGTRQKNQYPLSLSSASHVKCRPTQKKLSLKIHISVLTLSC